MKLWLSKGSYRAEFHLSFFESVASNDTIRFKLTSAGLSNVSVEGSGKVRVATGDWEGDEMEIELPSEVVKVEKL